MPDLASSWDDPTITDDASRELVLEAVRLSSRLVSSGARIRVARFLLLHNDILTCVAMSGDTEAVDRGPYRVSENTIFNRAITTGQIVDERSMLVVPARGDGDVVGVIAIDGEEGLAAAQLATLAAVAHIVGLGVSQSRAVTELQLEAERSRRLERLKSEFLNIAAHELRSPLGIIRGYTSMLSEGMLPSADREVALSRITEKSEEMARLISEMLETARLETLGLELELEPVDLLEIVDNAVHAMRPLMGPGHQFVLAATGDDIAVVADKRRLTTMLTNLIDNAIKYSPAGGEIEIALRSRRARGHRAGPRPRDRHQCRTGASAVHALRSPGDPGDQPYPRHRAGPLSRPGKRPAARRRHHGHADAWRRQHLHGEPALA